MLRLHAHQTQCLSQTCTDPSRLRLCHICNSHARTPGNVWCVFCFAPFFFAQTTHHLCLCPLSLMCIIPLSPKRGCCLKTRAATMESHATAPIPLSPTPPDHRVASRRRTAGHPSAPHLSPSLSLSLDPAVAASPFVVCVRTQQARHAAIVQYLSI